MRHFVNKLLIVVLLLCNVSSAFTQDLKSVKLSKEDRKNGIAKKYENTGAKHFSSLLILYRNHNYRYEENHLTTILFNEGTWHQTNGQLILKVHIKQYLKLDGFSNGKPKNENEFEAEYQTILNKSLPQYQSEATQNREHGWRAIRTYLLDGSNNNPEVIRKYQTQIKYILNNVVTPATAVNIKKVIEARTGVKF